MLDALAILVLMALVTQITGVDILMPDTLVNIPTSSSPPLPQAPAALQICLNMSRK